jgi:hypothetical protein
MYLYHFVYGVDRLESILNSGVLYRHPKIKIPAVCLTRSNHIYSSRGIRITFDYRKLKSNYKVKPFCLHGWNKVNKIPSNLLGKDEMEERCYNDIDIMRCAIRVDIDVSLYDRIKFKHPLINFVNLGLD